MSLKFLGSLGSLRCLGALGFLGAIASCTSHTGEGEMEPVAIGFHTHRIEEVGTRALISTTDDLRTPGFGVYGDKTVGTSSPQLVFDNIQVSGTPWDYKPTKYWDRTADYRFVAYAPWAESVTSYNAVNKELTISGIPQWQEVNSDVKDYLVAASANSAENYLTTYGGTVNLEFRHILSQLTVSISKVSPTATYTVTGLAIGQEGGVKVPITDTRTCTFDADGSGIGFSAHTTTGVQQLLSEANISVKPSPTELARYLVAPFDLGDGNKMSLTLYYTQSGGTPKSVPVSLDISKFESNCSYVFLLRFDSGNDVQVQVVQVKDWETIEVTDDVYNW